ncbi:MAG TPA: sulfatase-like hydrolase/transferase [Thermoanaerobaculia bacterium]|nr:sulfatase-like hydrolase/transferase [Thermoanaerobaculia bacterium]
MVAAACGRASAGRPPVVLISVDTLRADHLPIYGYRKLETPAVDALARDSIRFENAYSHVPLTLPSHAVLLTGLLPFENGVRDNLGFRLAPTHATLASRLRAAGYATGAAVSSYVLRADRGLNAGFDYYDDKMPDNPTRERSGVESADALARWATTVRDKPLFLFLHIYEPHAPYTPPEPFRSRYSDRPYDGEIAAADAGVGRLLDFLKGAGLYRRALIVLLSDHGEGLGDHGEAEHGVFLYREALRVPLLLKRPGSADAGRVVSTPVGLVDVVPTVLSVLSETHADGLSGVSLFRFLQGQGPSRRVYGETFYPRLNLGWSDLASLIDDRYQYIEAPRPELYDLVADSAEHNNLASQLPPPFRAMRAALAALARPFVGPEASTPEELKRLASLGYIHVSPPVALGRALPDPKDRIETLQDFHRMLDLFYAGKDEEVIPVARRVLAHDPGIFSAWTALAGSLERAGKKSEAIRALQDGISQSSAEAASEQLSPAYDDLVRLLKQVGDGRAQEQALRDAVARGVASEALMRDLARIDIQSGRAEEAIGLLRSASLQEVESLEVLGVALAAAGKNDEAKETLLRAWAAAPGDARVAFNLGTLALRQSDFREARDWFAKSIQLKPDDPRTLADLGLAQVGLGDGTAAAESWTKALELDPLQYDALYNLAVLELKNGHARQARARLEHFVASAPRDRYSRELREARRLLQGREKP